MTVPALRLWLCLPLLLATACRFDSRGLQPADGGATPDVGVPADTQTADAWADSAQHDAPGQTDLGASDLGPSDLGASDVSSDTSCAPQCTGKKCGAADGCGGTCQVGSGCCAPQCDRAVCGGADGCGGTCHGNNGDACGAAADTWRCVWIDGYSTWGSQVCRSGTWQTYSLSPRSCSGCCGPFSPDCCPSAGCYD